MGHSVNATNVSQKLVCEILTEPTCQNTAWIACPCRVQLELHQQQVQLKHTCLLHKPHALVHNMRRVNARDHSWNSPLSRSRGQDSAQDCVKPGDQ